MKKLCWLFLLMATTIKSYSQDSLISNNNNKHIIQISSLDLLIRKVSINYSYFLNNKTCAELMVSYRFDSKKDDRKIGFIQFEDPFWIYNQFDTRIGIGYYFSNQFYLSPMVVYNYRFFLKQYFDAYINREGELYDVDYELGRNRSAIGGLVKFGYMYSYHKIRINIYFGMGYSKSFQEEIVYNKYDFWKELIPDNYPIKTYTSKYAPTIHSGVLIGINLK